MSNVHDNFHKLLLSSSNLKYLRHVGTSIIPTKVFFNKMTHETK